MADCPLCKTNDATINYSANDVAHQRPTVACRRCGTYVATDVFINSSNAWSNEAWFLSAICRREHDHNRRITLTNENWKSLVDSTPKPATPQERIDRLLEFLLLKEGGHGEPTQILADHPQPAFCRSEKEWAWIRRTTQSAGFVELPNDTKLALTLKGYERLQQLKENRHDSTKAFVAMWFDASMTPVWENALKPAIEACGFTPIRVDEQQYNGDVVDKIKSEIRVAAFVVADVTGQRNGVYFEGGFAEGLAIPVIWTCKKAELEKVHFDTSHQNHIAWEAEADLKQRLMDRIRATIPRATLAT